LYVTFQTLNLANQPISDIEVTCSRYIGIDYTHSLLKREMELLGYFVLPSEANDLPFKDKYFDKAFSFSVFFYFPDKKYFKQVMKEMQRVTLGPIYIGDLPFASKDKNHLLYSLSDFKDYKDCLITRNYCCYPERFNVIVGAGVESE
jgi:ubiquinone/menaquinone biosynthesis C-methylase UbiE